MSAGNGQRKRRQYTAEERARVLASVRESGVVAAGRLHGVPMATVSNWAAKSAAESVTEAAPVADCVVSTAAPAASSEDRATSRAPVTEAAAQVTPRRPAQEKRPARRYTPSEKAEVLEHAAAKGVSAAHEKFKVSRFTVYDWQRRLAKAAKGEGPSPTSGPAPSEIEAQRDREILGEWRKHPGLGPSQSKNQLRRRNVRVSVATTRRVMEEQGYRPPKVKREPHDEHFETVRPNHLWHLDFVHRHINHASTFMLILLDDCTRFVTGPAPSEIEAQRAGDLHVRGGA